MRKFRNVPLLKRTPISFLLSTAGRLVAELSCFHWGGWGQGRGRVQGEREWVVGWEGGPAEEPNGTALNPGSMSMDAS